MSAPYVSRFVTMFQKLFEGPHINPKEDVEVFWSELLSLDVDRAYLTERLVALPKEDCLGRLKPLFVMLFSTCLRHAVEAPYDDPKKSHAVQIMTVLARCLLSKKDLAGWEVMELFAGGVNQSDHFFNKFASVVGTLLSDDDAPADLRHEVLQLAIVFMCGINQLSPGAYLLRKDLSPAIISIIRGRETGRFTFEALLLLALLSNFHKSDAAKLNPFLHHIGQITDVEVLRKVCWAAEFTATTTVMAYQEISDDSPPTMSSMIGSFVSSLRPDRAFSSTPVDTPKELFKSQPIEACIILLPTLEFVLRNRAFPSILIEGIKDGIGDKDLRPSLPHAVISLSSYLLTHATSTSSSRAIGYSNVALHILLAFAETDEVIRAFCEPSPRPVRLCRQRLPMLPFSPSPRPLICAVLDCCILWLRHNLHKRLETSLYLTCMRTCHRIIWFLQKEHIRLDYHWLQIWKAIIGLLDFLGGKLDELTSTMGVEQLFQEVYFTCLVGYCINKAEAFLSSPQAIHEFIYELVRSAPALRRLSASLRSLISPRIAPIASRENPSERALSHLLSITNFYEEKVGAKSRSADNAMRIVAKEIERDGIHVTEDSYLEDPPYVGSEGVNIFLRHVYSDGMALMP
ncbi:hypothetical protein B0F90DRAFT_1807431 [Multifurca ochricompacta]|uniref:Armadillo-like helical domain-containing protein n=1 Tax=Multifurca ochricompacta TaxID=376703 RepID=A0AAD4MD23_9AGAM|nr:hypothetical protein B0F90DRAFT_1807431 [Multifurca ochricompacta]